eukprot:TRINITY_DN5055_c0_g2_i1.p1 TRINITY_DN5055_c0_g2~~TRINITY_DN5055_c0_g2_i1.p1  ORF type:complete len:488 (+),score=76.27 TRINITY_DN5055_c0_g2_i1:102-1565(+)
MAQVSESREVEQDANAEDMNKPTTVMLMPPPPLRRGLSRLTVNKQGLADEGMDPKEAMMKLLSHVTLDPDGGILNLDDGAEQESKVGAIKKTKFEMCFAFLIVVRVLVNSYHIFWVSSVAIRGYLLSGHAYHDRIKAEFKHLQVSLPFAELVLMTHIAELCMLARFTAKALWHAVKIVTSPGTRYSHVAKLFWSILPRMVGVSTLQVLTYVHPALLARSAKESTKTHKAASRTLLLEILNMSGQEHVMADEDLVYEAYHITQRPAGSSMDGSEEAFIGNAFLASSTPNDAISALATHSDTIGEGVDPEALGRAWRLDLIFYAERALWVLFCAMCTALGTLAFFLKICELAVRLVSPMEAAEKETLWRLVVFLNQVLSIVNLRRLLIVRVQTFIFGGSDAMVSEEEMFIMDYYFGRLAEVVLKSKSLSCVEKCCIMIQLDDEDLQELTVEENWHVKASITRSVKKYMERQGLGRRNDFVDCLIGRKVK